MKAIVLASLIFSLIACASSKERRPAQNIDIGSEFTDPIKKTTKSEKIFKGAEAEQFARQLSQLTQGKVPDHPAKWTPQLVANVTRHTEYQVIVFNQNRANPIAVLPVDEKTNAGIELMGLLSKGHKTLVERMGRHDYSVFTVSCRSENQQNTCTTVLTVEPGTTNRE